MCVFVCVLVVEVQGHWVEVGWVRGSHSLCRGSFYHAISLRLRPPNASGPPDVSPVLITGSTAGSRGGGLQMEGWGGRRAAGREGGEGGNGVTLTEPAVDKTLRQIRQSRVWSLFCFPLLLLSGGISLLLLSDIPALVLWLFSTFRLSLTFLHHPLLSLSKQKYSCCYRTAALQHPLDWGTFSPLASSLCFCFLLTAYRKGEETAFDWQQKHVFDIEKSHTSFITYSIFFSSLAFSA